jgi:hypothetical protein
MAAYVETPLADVIHPDDLPVLQGVLSSERLRTAIEMGGIIAGGFPRTILSGGRIKEYLSYSDNGRLSGDIDVFFTDLGRAQDAVVRCGFENQMSFGGFAKEKRLGARLNGDYFSYSLQLVDNPRLIAPSVEDHLDRFDMVNCQVALVGDRLLHREGVKELNESRLIRINRADSPFLGSRILKYLKFRGFEGIEESSYPLLVEWLARVVANDFPGFEKRYEEGTKSAVTRLYQGGHMRKDELIMFLGKWKMSFSVGDDKYGPRETVEVDWAHREIEQPSMGV